MPDAKYPTTMPADIGPTLNDVLAAIQSDPRTDNLTQFIEMGVPPNLVLEHEEMTLLIYAVFMNNEKAVDILLKRGADPNFVYSGRSPLAAALQAAGSQDEPNYRIARKLFERRANPALGTPSANEIAKNDFKVENIVDLWRGY